jgi:hypothetical protein
MLKHDFVLSETVYAHFMRKYTSTLAQCCLCRNLGWGRTYHPVLDRRCRKYCDLGGSGQARTARLCHEEQTEADRQRRITENFTRAVEQLGSDGLQARLGGISALERIARESEPDKWTRLETLTGILCARANPLEGQRPAPSQTVVRFYQPEPSQPSAAEPLVGRWRVLLEDYRPAVFLRKPRLTSLPYGLEPRPERW